MKACKNEIKLMIREIVRSELEEIKQEIEMLKENMQGRIGEAVGNERKGYVSAVIGKKKENDNSQTKEATGK